MHLIIMFQRPGPDADVAATEPLVFADTDPVQVLLQLRAHIDREFDIEGSCDAADQQAYAEAISFDKLKLWFERSYCYFDIKQLHFPF